MNKITKIAKKIAVAADIESAEIIDALADYLGIDVGEIEAEGISNYYQTKNDGEYLVFDDEEKANDAAIESVENLLDEIGIKVVNGWENFINTDYFDYDRREYWRTYASDVWSESDYGNKFENRCIQEAYDCGVLTDDDFELDENGEVDYTLCKKNKDTIIDDYGERCYEDDDPIDWIEQSYGDKLLEYCPGCVKLGELAEYVVDNDGRGAQLSGYDGKERVHNYNGKDYYIYKTND